MTQAHAEGATGAHPALSAAARGWLFFRRWLANPLEMGSIVPSSPVLGRKIAEAVRTGPPGPILELGAGTGAITRALLDGGIAPSRLTVIEIVPEMAEVLRQSFPGVTVICGDAWQLSDILDPALPGTIGSVVCGIPLVLLPREKQASLIAAIEAVAPGRGFLHYTYCVTSPLPIHAHRLEGRRIAWTPLNIPPASVWHYRRIGP
ncbi:class I SAM-dependent methyltransferase [Elioraea thermophila]|uniref:class I SAM-dependent methyltransferase n=1 Tax=Elioraea thermophila TaxID=2185104 RepID=UPI000DF3A8C1|nr:methyltransferase domain-containing protein [Elioraea thermophila]